MSCIPSAAYRIILARCTVRNGKVTVPAPRPPLQLGTLLLRELDHVLAGPRHDT